MITVTATTPLRPSFMLPSTLFITKPCTWFSRWHHQIVKSKQQSFANSHLNKVEDKQKINPCTSFQSHSMFHFKTTAI